MNRDEGINIHLSRGHFSEEFNSSLYVFCEDVDQLYNELKLKKATISNAIDDREYGMRDFDILDNNGYRITFGKNIPNTH